jgi:hypothetical protein
MRPLAILYCLYHGVLNTRHRAHDSGSHRGSRTEMAKGMLHNGRSHLRTAVICRNHSLVL